MESSLPRRHRAKMRGERGPTTDADWAAAFADFLALGTSERALKTQEYYQCQIGGLVRWAGTEGVTLADFRARHLRQYLALRLARSISETTRHHDAVTAKVFFKFCRAEGYVDADPLAGYKIRKAAQPLCVCPTEDQLRVLLKSIESRWKPAVNPSIANIDPKTRRFNMTRMQAIVSVLIDTGARIGEVLSLRTEDYQPEAKQLVFPVTKGRTFRIVPVSPLCQAALEAWLRVRPKASKSGLVFMSLYDKPLDVKSFSAIFKGYVAYAGLPHFSPHGLRRYAATRMAEINPHDASLILGHKDSKTTRGYLYTSAEHIRAVQTEAAPLSRLLINKRCEANRKRIL